MIQEPAQSAIHGALPSDEERGMLQESLRRLLMHLWPADQALALATAPHAVASIWRELAEQGLTSLGSEPAEGGLREIVVVMEELGRAACPVPLIDASLANIALWSMRSSSEEAAS